MLSSQIILIVISVVFSVMTLVITVLQPVFIMVKLSETTCSDCHRCLIKNFNEQAFLYELASVKWYRISLILSVGFLFDSAMPPCLPKISSSPTPSNATIPDAPPSFSPAPLQSFSLQAVTESEVLEELLEPDPKKTSGSEGLDPFFLQVTAYIIAKPIAKHFNLSLLSGEVPIAWKAVTVRPLFKGGDQADPNCFWPIYILHCLSPFSLVCNPVSAQVMDVLLQP
jgi:hypothetical protein